MFSWRWSLALLQVVIAFAAIVYAPYEYRAGPHPIHDDFMMLGYRSVWPPLVLRSCYMVNFPALAAITPLRFTGNWPVRDVVRHRGSLYIHLSVDDCMFLAAVGVLWLCIGNMIDYRNRRTATDPKQPSVSLVIGLLSSLGVGALATFYTTLTDADRPFRQIGVAGLIWTLALFWYFVSHLVSSRTPARQIG